MKRAGVLAGVWGVLLLGGGLAALWTFSPALRVAPERKASPAVPPGSSKRPTVHAASAEGTVARIRGQVRDARGPVVGARVLASKAVEGETLSSLPCGSNPELSLLECRMSRKLSDLVLQRVGDPPLLAQVTTGTDGAFSLEGLPPGPYALWVEAPEGVALRRDVRPGAEDVTLVLEPGVRVSGVVRGEDKAPLAGALVTALPTLHSRFFEALSDASGHFTLGALPRGDYTVVVTREGRVPARLGFLGYTARMELNPVLEWPRRLSGVVLREGVPVAGATVSTATYPDDSERWVRTDAQGRFAFDDLPPQGTYDLEATQEGAKGELSVDFTASEEPQDVLLRERTRVVVELKPTVGLSGTVRDTAGRPVEAARVDVSLAPEFAASVRTDAQGHYAVEFLPPGTFQVEASAPGHLLAENPPVEIHAGMGHADLVLTPAAILSGLLVDAEARPVEGEALIVTSLEQPEDFQAWSDKAGRFSVDLPRAGRYLLKVNSPRARDRPGVEVTAPGEVRLRVEPRPEIRGEVVDETNLPLPGVSVSLWEETPSGTQQMAYVRTDVRGRFKFLAPAEGTYPLVAEFALGDDLTQTVSRRLVVGPRGVETQLRLEGSQVLSGVVVDSAGRPVEGAEVEVVAPLHARPPGCGRTRLGGQWTDPRGRFHFERVSGEDLSLAVRKEGYGLSCRDLPPEARGMPLPLGAREVRVRLVKQASVSGRLVRADGTPVEQYDINGSIQMNSGGRFTWDFTCAGPLTLELSALGEQGAVSATARLRHTVLVQEEQDLDVGTLVLGAL